MALIVCCFEAVGGPVAILGNNCSNTSYPRSTQPLQEFLFNFCWDVFDTIGIFIGFPEPNLCALRFPIILPSFGRINYFLLEESKRTKFMENNTTIEPACTITGWVWSINEGFAQVCSQHEELGQQATTFIAWFRRILPVCLLFPLVSPLQWDPCKGAQGIVNRTLYFRFLLHHF